MSNPENSNRRRFIQQLGAVLGAGAGASLLTATSVQAALAYNRSGVSAEKAGRLFSQPQMQLLALICDVVLPKTDTPSGAEVDCHGFIDQQLVACHSKAEQQGAIALLQLVEQRSSENHQTSFKSLTDQQKQRILQDIETGKTELPENRERFKHLKALIVFGYFTSEVGATQALNYQMIPGGYKGSIPATADTKAWGSLAYY